MLINLINKNIQLAMDNGMVFYAGKPIVLCETKCRKMHL